MGVELPKEQTTLRHTVMTQYSLKQLWQVLRPLSVEATFEEMKQLPQHKSVNPNKWIH